MLEQPDLPAERRLRHVQAFRGAPEMKLLADGKEAPKLADFEHDSSPESIQSVIGLIWNQSGLTITSIRT